MAYLYVLFTRSDTWFSELVGCVTPGDYTHVSLSMDRSLRQLYSFGRRHPQTALPAGFIREDVHAGIMGRCGGRICSVYRVSVSEDGCRKAGRLLQYMDAHALCYHYDLIGAAFCAVQRTHNSKNRFFCSHFVAEILSRSGAAILPKAANLMRPADLLELQELELVYEGPLCTSDLQKLPESA